MTDPLFWLGLSILLVAISLTAVLVAALPALQELSRAARSAEKLFDTLSRELPPTLQAIRLTGLEISELTDEIDESVKSTGRVVKQVDRSLESARQQTRKAQITARSTFAGLRAAWKVLTRSSSLPPQQPSEHRHRPTHSPPEHNHYPISPDSLTRQDGPDRENSHAMPVEEKR